MRVMSNMNSNMLGSFRLALSDRKLVFAPKLEANFHRCVASCSNRGFDRELENLFNALENFVLQAVHLAYSESE